MFVNKKSIFGALKNTSRKFGRFMSGSCHFDRASNDKFSVEF